MKRKIGPIKVDSILSDVIKTHPALRGKISEYFGKRCLTCPSSKKETIAYTAFNRGHRPEVVVEDLNRILADKRKEK